MPGEHIALPPPGRLPVSPDEEFVHEGFRLEHLFPAANSTTPAPLEIEFGSGKGRFLIESGRLHSDRHFLGVERSLAYYRIARDRIARAHIDHVRVIRADAAKIVDMLPGACVDAFHAYFLDPWPKKKQRKRRLLGPAFLTAAAAKARSGASFRIITDHEDYADAIAAAADRIIEEGTPWRSVDWESLPTPPLTHYELKYRAAGRSFRRFLLIRK